MASNYGLYALLVVLLAATSATADKEKKDKMMGVLNCLTMESLKTIVETRNATLDACMAEMGPISGATTETAQLLTTGRPTREAKQHRKPNMCFMECMWRKGGLVKDGNLAIDDYAKANVKPEFQEKFVSKVQKCLTKEGLSTSYTLNKDDQCKSLEKYGKCFHKAAKVCKTDSSSSEED